MINYLKHSKMRSFVTFTVVFLCTTIGAVAQTKPSSHQIQKDSVLNKIDSLVQITNVWLEQIELDYSLKQRYKLYQTENIYTLLQLDTKTGMIEQVQWSLDSENEGSVIINNDDLNLGFGYGSGSFELYPTKNMYQFILLDKTSGRKWHVQWGMKPKERWIRRIY